MYMITSVLSNVWQLHHTFAHVRRVRLWITVRRVYTAILAFHALSERKQSGTVQVSALLKVLEV